MKIQEFPKLAECCNPDWSVDCVHYYFCGVCAKCFPKGSHCLGWFINDDGIPNHIEYCETEEEKELWKRKKDIFGNTFYEKHDTNHKGFCGFYHQDWFTQK